MKAKIILTSVLLIIIQALCFSDDLHIILRPEIIKQGKCFTIKITSAEGIKQVEALLLGQKIKLFKDYNNFAAIIGVPPEQRPGQYPLSLLVIDDNGREARIEKNIVVHKTKFPYASFWLKPAKKKLLTSRDLITEEWARIEKSLLVEQPNRSWIGKFSLPVTAPTSMRFGTVERVNGKARGQHRGLDLAAPMSTEVVAANNGKVVFAEKLKAFGGTLIIDYGQGIHSLYFHLTDFAARVGDEVTKGQLVAFSGNTGISSGPHLHWGMSVHNVRVDPQQWVREEL